MMGGGPTAGSPPVFSSGISRPLWQRGERGDLLGREAIRGRSVQTTVEATVGPEVTAQAERAYIPRLVALFCAGWAVIYADRAVLYPLLTVIARDFGLSGTQTGLITGTYFTLYVVTLLLSGLLAERFGLKRVLVIFSFVSAVGVAGFGFAAVNYVALLVVAGLHGAGAGPYYTMAYSIMIHTVPSRLRGVAPGVNT